MTTKINIVLLTDDSKAANSRLISMLEDTDSLQVVLQTTNYTEALEMMEEFKPDYILIDTGLSEVAGMSVIKEIRDKHKGSKIVVITNFNGNHYGDFCETMGVNYFLDTAGEVELVPKAIKLERLN